MLSRRRLATTALTLLVSVAVVKAQDDVWVSQFGTPEREITIALSADTTGIYVGGSTLGTFPDQSAEGDEDAYVRKYDTFGSELWTRQFGTPSWDGVAGVVSTYGGVYVVGHTEGALSGQTLVGQADAFIRKYDSHGLEVWTRQFAIDPSQLRVTVATAVAADASAVYVTGQKVTDPFSQTIFLRKYDHDGNEHWTHLFDPGTLNQVRAISIDVTGIYLAGISDFSGTFEIDALIAKFDHDGEIQWHRQFGTDEFDRAEGIATGPTGVYVSGWTPGTLPRQLSSGGDDVYLRKYDTGGNEVWTRQFGTPSDDSGGGVGIDGNHVFVSGATQGEFPDARSTGGSDAFVRKYDFEGIEDWTLQLGSPQNDGAWAVEPANSGIYIGGLTFGAMPGETHVGGSDVFIAGIDVGRMICQIEMSQATYSDGDMVAVRSWRIANTTREPTIPFELEVWWHTPVTDPEQVLSSDTGERLIMPPGFDMDFGTQDLFEVTPEVWRGTYQVNCHLVDPDTKRLLLLDRSSFVIH